jgi:murein L,D-transpeptidase YcbB/YkuD
MNFIMKSIAITILLLSLFLLSRLPTVSADQPSPAGALLQRWFIPFTMDAARHSVDPRTKPIAAVARFYRCRGYKPAWVDKKGLLPQAEIMLEAIRSAPNDGLPAMDSGISELAFNPKYDILLAGGEFSSSSYSLARLDVALTAAMLQYAAHLSQGYIQPQELSEVYVFQGKASSRDLAGELAGALNGNRLEKFVNSLHPQQRAYQELKNVLRRYRRIQAMGGWPFITAGPVLKIGSVDVRVPTLRRHLAVTGDLQVDSWTEGDRFDLPLETAVKRYQQRHGLSPDGIVGDETRQVLNVPVERRIIQLMLNMERWRWFPCDLGSRYVMVNIPAFELQLVQNEAEVLSMRVIVGRESRPTPILASQLTYLELNPSWNIPQKIARQDILPKIQADPEYLDRKGILVFDSWQEEASALDPYAIDWTGLSKNHFPYRLQQQPAADNALGRIKFMFPNRHSVYIHDTPGKSLFSQPQRLYSSGCVRVEKPLVLAHYLLKDRHWNRERLAMAVASNQSRTIFLQSPVPVYLVYFTAWTDAAGHVQFRNDIYGHDHRLLLDFLKAEANIYFCSAREPRKKESTY